MSRVEADASPVLDPLETIVSRGFSRYDVFRDWVRLMLAALQRDDDRYLGILDSYDRDRGRERDRGERNADLFAAAFGELQAAMAETNQDVLGIAYEAWGMQSEAFGQHFTPHTVAAAMADAAVSTDEVSDPPVTIADPACGSGRMLILAARRVDESTFVFGQDKDLLCAQMAALNCCFFNLDGIIIYGDTLTLEAKRAWETASTILGGEIREMDDPEALPLPEAAFRGASADGEGEAVSKSDPKSVAERVSVTDGGGQTDLRECFAGDDT